MTQTHQSRYQWAGWGDLNAFFGLMLDNVTNLVILAGLLNGVFGYPLDFIYKLMIPGTALGVMLGDLVYTWMAFKLAHKTGNQTVTAMPLGLDTPSTIGIAVAVLGPTYLATKDPYLTWQVGMATLVLIGIVKLIMSFFGDWIRAKVPQAGLLGSLAGIGLALLAFLPLLTLFKMPLVGVVALGIIIYTLVARLRLPGGIPGAAAAVGVGTILYFILGLTSLLGNAYNPPQLALTFTPPLPSLGFLKGLKLALNYLPIAIPFGLLTIIGGINVTESARVAGDAYRTRDILLTEAIATLIAGLCGGVSQSTPYIGHPAYKKMGGRAAYTLATGLFIGLGGALGFISSIVEVLPEAAVAPILIFVGLEIIVQAYHACPKAHAAAVAFAHLPIVANLLVIELKGVIFDGGLKAFLAGQGGKNILELLSPATLQNYYVILALGNGFILTAMLWGAMVALICDRKLLSAAAYLGIAAVMTFFGVIHSVGNNAEMYLPWTLPAQLQVIPYQFTLAYLILALLLLLLALHPASQAAAEEDREMLMSC
jgi:AGZA family xanthine/uracil permease-like MFS transporter